MKKLWICLVYTASIATLALTASIPTTETLVVAKTDDEVSTTPAPSEPATEEPNAPIKMTEMRVRSEVTMRYAHTAVVTHVRNPASRAQEATFHVLLPDTAFISGFVMTLGGKSYKAYVKEKNEAKQIFNEAVSHGMGAAHIAAKARDSNHFTVSVNVEPKSVAIFNLTYEELLVRRIGVYNHAINLHPGTLVPKLEVVVHIKESQKITTLRVPEVRTGNEIDATENDAQNSKAVQIRNGDKEATITFTPDLDEQMNLIKIYKDKTKDSGSRRYWENNEENSKDGILGQFVVQYDVERSNNGEVLVNDGYFVHFLAPSTLPPLNKYVVFVLDTSSSMIGRKVEQLITAMEAILSDLNPNDYFSIVEFNSDFSVHELKEADEPEPEPPKFSWYGSRSSSNKELVPPALASPENIAKAKVIISRLRANGGTNIYSALDVAMNLIHKFSGKNDAGLAKSNSSDAVAVAGNDVNTKPVSDLEPIIIFLTDGDPTVGETSTSRIISYITEKNSGEMRASLFSLAFGEDADRSFLRKLSLRNEGFMRHIYEAADAALQLRDFYKQVSSPLLAHVKFTYPREQIKEGSVSKSKFRTVYAGSEVIVAGELAEDSHELESVVSGFCGNRDGARIPFEDHSKVKVTHVKDFLPLERLWAYLSIKQLLDQRDASDDKAADEHEKKALNLALKYSFVTPLTSLVVVKPNETNAVDAESVDKNNQFSDLLPDISPLSIHANALPPASHNAYVGPQFVSSFGSPGLVPALALQGGLADIQAEFEDDIRFEDIDLRPRGDIFRNRGIQPQSRMSINRLDSLISGGYQPTPSRSSFSGYRFASDEDDYDGYSGWSLSQRSLHPFANFKHTLVISTTPAPPAAPEVQTTEIPVEKKYHLENYSWALGLLNNSAGALVFIQNETQIVLELSNDSKAPHASPEESCTNMPTGAEGPGSCVYITRCIAARNISVDDYRSSYCRVDNRYAGVCCPNSMIEPVAV